MSAENQKSKRKVLAQFSELVILMTIEKPKDKEEIRNCMDIVSDLVDRSDEVVVGTLEKVTQQSYFLSHA